MPCPAQRVAPVECLGRGTELELAMVSQVLQCSTITVPDEADPVVCAILSSH